MSGQLGRVKLILRFNIIILKLIFNIAANGDSVLRNNSGNDRMELDASGNATFSGNVTAYGTPSDIRLKENIEVIDNALDKVKQLKGITYDLKSDGNRLTGLIAQDLESFTYIVYTTNSLGDSVNEEPKETLSYSLWQHSRFISRSY